jgi:hypothetical protein
MRATFPQPASSVTVTFGGSTATPALLEAFDAEGNVVDRASLASIPVRKAPGEPVPIFTMTVKGPRIAHVQFSGPRTGEYLAADEVRFTPTAAEGVRSSSGQANRTKSLTFQVRSTSTSDFKAAAR